MFQRRLDKETLSWWNSRSQRFWFATVCVSLLFLWMIAAGSGRCLKLPIWANRWCSLSSGFWKSVPLTPQMASLGIGKACIRFAKWARRVAADRAHWFWHVKISPCHRSWTGVQHGEKFFGYGCVAAYKAVLHWQERDAGSGKHEWWWCRRVSWR